MAVDADFKRDPKAFMAKQIVIPCLPSGDLLRSDTGPDGCADVYVRESATKRDASGERKVCEMYLAKGKAVATVKIYWCPYDNNQVKSAILGTKASYMFTSGMNMCTFGVGSQPGDGSCRVAHANSVGGVIGVGKTTGGNVAQIQRQTDMVTGLLGNDASRIQPDTYMLDHGGQEYAWCATTFGRLEGSHWKFYVQKWMRLGSTRNQLYVFGGLDDARFT